MEHAPKPFFFDSEGARLFGCLHAAKAPARELGVVLVHPFMEERQDSHAVLFDLACRLADARLPTLRFDQYGCGDSEGDWADGTLEHWLDDVRAAVRVLRAETGVTEVCLVGLRFGATLAALAADSVGASKVVLVQPVVRGDTYAMDLLLANLASEMVLNRKTGVTRELLLARLDAGEAVNIFGYHFTAAQYRALRNVDIARDARAEGPPTLLLDVARTAAARTPKELQFLIAALGARATTERAVETNSLFSEGKIRMMRADEVCRLVLAFLDEAP
jgi:exosortase A-associated hydrolase 2